MKTCVFAGTFDPITIGHLEIVEQALEKFDKVIVALGVNPEKKPTFSKEVRKEILESVFKDNPRVEVCAFDGYLVDFMKQNNITTTIRGIRNATDLEYEKIMDNNNRAMYPEIETVFLPCSAKTKNISSTLVREKLQKKESIVDLVPTVALPIIIRSLRIEK